ncbi:K02A2.6-like [Cordylochernes scorpioides]|uniref:K02A2.6-like n=1 Tax=Cordylochernes scorpioides TaxID=51811 RepID=A0ABY6LTU1_9ARAC|nr:K02A2.6-like [Cordylochernes scorpioides]
MDKFLKPVLKDIGSAKEKIARTKISLEKKLSIIKAIESGTSQAELRKKMKMSKSSISTIWGKREDYKKRMLQKGINPNYCRYRQCHYPLLEEALYTCLEEISRATSNFEQYVHVDDNEQVFAEMTDEEIIKMVTNVPDIDLPEEEEEEEMPSSSQVLSSLKWLKTYSRIFDFTAEEILKNEDFFARYETKLLRNMLKQKKITDYIKCGIEYKVEETPSTKKRTRESPSDSTPRSHKTPRMEVVSQHNENDVSMNEVNEENIDEDGPWTKVTHTKKPRIPPVIAENVTDWKLLCQELKDLCTDKFQCTISGNKHIIKAKNISDFKKIREFVQKKKKNNGGYSYRLQEEKPLKVVLKGVTTSYKTEDIAIELATMGFTETSVKRLHRQSTKRPMNLVLKIAVESFRTTNRVTQCFNCQSFGHGQLNCFLKPKCVKCADEHHSKIENLPKKVKTTSPKVLPLKTEVDIDSAVGILNEKINNSYSKNTIVSSSKLIKNPKTKALIREKNKARKRWQSTWDPAHRATYLNLQGKAEDEVPSYLTDNTCHHPQENILSMTTPNEVKEVIKNLGNHKAPGHDNITPQMTKNLPIKWIVFLAGIFNAALHLCYFPKTWKHAIIITIPKKSPVKSPEDLRPISLLYHRKGHSTTHQLITVIDYIQIRKSHKEAVGAAASTSNIRGILRKNVVWHWGPKQDGEFDHIKECVRNAPSLAHFDKGKMLILQCDASKDAMGAALLQEDRPLAFASASFSVSQKQYSQIEKELLSVYYGCKKFEYLLSGHTFVVQTDHQPLLPLVKKPLSDISPRLQRLVMKLIAFDFKLQYKPGKYLIVADTLSRDTHPMDELPTPFLEDKRMVKMSVMEDRQRVSSDTTHFAIYEEDVDRVLCRRGDGDGVVLEAHREDPGLQVRRPPDDGEGLSNERTDGAAGPVAVGQRQVAGAAGDADRLARRRMPRMRQGVQGQPQSDVRRMAPEGAAAEG